MRKRLLGIILMLVAAGLDLSGQDLAVERLMHQGDSLHRLYLFDQAIEKYMSAMDLADDPATARLLEKRGQQVQYAINMTEICADPHVVARDRFSRKDFFQYYPVKPQSWHSSPNILDSLAGYPTYFPKDATSLIFSAQDRAKVRNLYFTHSTDSSWTAPRLLGESLTTLGNEIYPMLSPDGKTLYFSSDGLYGIGGYDLYFSNWDEETQSWSEPQNMGFPFSSPGDDFLLMDTDDGRYTIFASNRDCSADSVYVYVLDYAGSRDRKMVIDHEDIVRIASLTPVEELGRMDQDALMEEVEETDNSLTYSRVNAEIRALRDSLAAHAGDADTARIDEIMARITELNKKKNELSDSFLKTGMVTEKEDKEIAGEGLSYTFTKNTIGPRIRIKIDRPRPNTSFRVMPVGRMAPDNTLPPGIVYQIQFAQATRTLDVEALGGLTPVYRILSPNLRYIYSVGLFEHYYEALAELNTVRAQGFPDAVIIAWRDGRQISVSQARQEE